MFVQDVEGTMSSQKVKTLLEGLRSLRKEFVDLGRRFPELHHEYYVSLRPLTEPQWQDFYESRKAWAVIGRAILPENGEEARVYETWQPFPDGVRANKYWGWGDGYDRFVGIATRGA